MRNEQQTKRSGVLGNHPLEEDLNSCAWVQNEVGDHWWADSAQLNAFFKGGKGNAGQIRANGHPKVVGEEQAERVIRLAREVKECPQELAIGVARVKSEGSQEEVVH